MPKPIEVKNADGVTVVTNAGCSGKYIGVMDLDIKDHKVIGASHFHEYQPLIQPFHLHASQMTSLGKSIFVDLHWIGHSHHGHVNILVSAEIESLRSRITF
jgi:hypothetical protein